MLRLRLRCVTQTVSFIQLWFTLFAAFSDQEVFDGVLLNSFNLLWTSLPILFLATFDRDVCMLVLSFSFLFFLSSFSLSEWMNERERERVCVCVLFFVDLVCFLSI